MTKWDYDRLQDPEDKTFSLRFLPWLGADNLIGYTPAWVKRGYGYGRWEEFFTTEAEAKKRMQYLIDANAIEDAEIRKAVPGQGMVTVLLHEWKVKETSQEEGQND